MFGGVIQQIYFMFAHFLWDHPKAQKEKMKEKPEKNRKPDREKYDYRLIFHGGAKVTALLITLTLSVDTKQLRCDKYFHNYTTSSSRKIQEESLMLISHFNQNTLKIQLRIFSEEQSWKVE